jgi:ketol-acid reductoisomerase
MKRKEQVAVLGYGSQGRAIAQNLRDSGHRVVVGLRKKSAKRAAAVRDGLTVGSIPEAARRAGIIIVAVSDDAHKQVLNSEFFGGLDKRPWLVFLHGATIHFGLVKPPKDIPVALLAPHAPGLAVRANYLNKQPYSAFYAVHRGPKTTGIEMLTRLAKAIGIPRTHLVKTTIADEAVGDLFGEQAVLCGGLARLLKFGFETLVDAGYPPQNAYLEVAYQIDLIVNLIKQHGLAGMFERISPLARYGSAVNGPKVITSRVKADMNRILADIESGAFMRRAERAGLKPSAKDMDNLLSSPFDRQVKRFSR